MWVTMLISRGLSPRVRGNPTARHPKQPAGGSIPACAGEPFSSPLPLAAYWVYPRVCGGTTGKDLGEYITEGLSPRVRGNQIPRRASPAKPGSIPACAGEPWSGVRWSVGAAVYPRVCGGTRGQGQVEGNDAGLSPRVRGNPAVGDVGVEVGGSIPACAGEPRQRRRQHPTHMVYPRVCGGTKGCGRRFRLCCGLSPRVRGNRGDTGDGLLKSRSIPACAGEPDGHCAAPSTDGVYPRVCGGTSATNRMTKLAAGLSPRVRGNRTWRESHPAPGRSIPACAGEPASAASGSPTGRVYPRVCGGTLVPSG